MTLAEWVQKTGAVIQDVKGAKVLPYRPDADLWRLSDYAVSAVMGGSIWLVPKTPA